MYERFTDRARKVMALANQTAAKLNHDYIGTEHVLIGILKVGSGVGWLVLQNLDVDVKKLQAEIETSLTPEPDKVCLGLRPLKNENFFQFAIDDARDLNHNYVGTEHFLLAILKEKDSKAAKVLETFNVTHAIVKGEIIKSLGDSTPPPTIAFKNIKEQPPLQALSEMTIEDRVKQVSDCLWTATRLKVAYPENPDSIDPKITAAVVSATGEIVKSLIIKGIR